MNSSYSHNCRDVHCQTTNLGQMCALDLFIFPNSYRARRRQASTSDDWRICSLHSP